VRFEVFETDQAHRYRWRIVDDDEHGGAIVVESPAAEGQPLEVCIDQVQRVVHVCRADPPPTPVQLAAADRPEQR
jgi:hypothetical protein